MWAGWGQSERGSKSEFNSEIENEIEINLQMRILGTKMQSYTVKIRQMAEARSIPLQTASTESTSKYCLREATPSVNRCVAYLTSFDATPSVAAPITAIIAPTAEKISVKLTWNRVVEINPSTPVFEKTE